MTNEEEWTAELDRRLKDVQENKVELIDHEESMRLARERLASRQFEKPSIVQRLAGVAKNVSLGDDDHGILARAALVKYERHNLHTLQGVK